MLNGLPVDETVSVGTVTMGPALFTRPGWPPVIQHPILDKVTSLLTVD
jgi:hypothetical protein